jgi:hypothetical protein
MFLEYNISKDDPSWINCKPNHMVKITYQDQFQRKESFWVWIENINGDEIVGIISNELLTYNLSLGDRITFHTKYIKEISERNYSIDHTAKLNLEKIKSNPITKYFNSLNVKFS